MQHDEYPDRLVHFAHSLREVIDQLARHDQKEDEHDRSMGKKERKAGLERLLGPVRQGHSVDLPSERLADAYAKLSKVVHHRESLSDELAHSMLLEVEESLSLLFRRQSEINAEMDSILRGDPSLASARKLVSLQRDRLQTQIQLVDKMSVRWLGHMNEAGFFENPTPASDGKKQEHVRWEPGRYLQKCTKVHSGEVADIIVKCKFKDSETPNLAVYRDFLICAAGLAAADMEKVGRKALREDWDRFIGWDWFEIRYLKVAEELYRSGRHDVAVCMLHRALKPKLSESRSALNADWTRTERAELEAPFNPHVFREILRKMAALAKENPLPMAKLLDNLLHESIVLDNQRMGRDAEHDDGGHWRAAIEESDQNNIATVPSLLVSCIRDCLVHAVRRDGAEAMKILYRRDHCVYRRLELYIYAEFLRMFRKKAALAASWYFGCRCTHHEYYRLLEVAFQTLPGSTKQEILGKIEAGYDPVEFELLKRSHGEAHATRAEKRWKLRFLEAIKDHLDEKHKKMYTELLEVGRHEHYDYHSYVRVLNAETETDSFDGKDTDEILEIAKNYKPPESLVDDDGVADGFRKHVKARPLECSKRAPRLGSAPPRIQYELFLALRDAVSDGERIEWGGVLSLIGDVLARRASAQNPPIQDGPDGQEPATRLLDQSVIEYLYDPLLPLFWLVEEGLKNDSLDFGLKDRVWNVVKELVKVGDKLAGPDEYCSANQESEYRIQSPNAEQTNQTSALTLSMNGLNGASFHTLYQYSMWCKKHGDERTMDGGAKEAFDRYLSDQESHTISRHAVLGVFLPDFYYLDQEWAKSMPGEACKSKAAKVAFWDGYVSGKQMYAYVFGDLWKRYGEFMNGNIVSKPHLSQIRESTVWHVMLAYFYGLDNADFVVEKFLENGDGKAISMCPIYKTCTLNDA